MRMRKGTNLLEETREALAEAGCFPADVSWVGSRDGTFGVTWGEFERIANVEYHAGYGGQEVADDLVVVFTEGRGWLERGAYDGSEWWEHKSRPILQSAHRRPAKVVDRENSGSTVAEMNGIPSADGEDDD